jgi:hypothetical protein
MSLLARLYSFFVRRKVPAVVRPTPELLRALGASDAEAWVTALTPACDGYDITRPTGWPPSWRRSRTRHVASIA